MPKEKYKFDPESLSYTRVEHTLRDKVLKGLTYFSAGVVVAIFYIALFYVFFDTPKEKGLKRENNQLIIQYNHLSDRLEQIDNVLGDLKRRDENIYRAIFEAEPIPGTIREAGFGGIDRYQDLEQMKNSAIVVQTTQKLDELMNKMKIQSISYDELEDIAGEKEDFLSALPAIQPIYNRNLTRVASGFGYHIHPIYRIMKMHEGIDFTAPSGTDIYATADGEIIEAQYSKRGYGNKIVIDHGFNYKTVYAHLEDIKVKRGQKVKRGDIIGTVGNTGLSTAPHLHYEVLLNDKTVNPVSYFFNDLSPKEYDKMIEISMRPGLSFD